MKISTFLSGLLCLTPAPAVSRRLTGGMSKQTNAKDDRDEYYENLYGDGVEPQEGDEETDYDETEIDPALENDNAKNDKDEYYENLYGDGVQPQEGDETDYDETEIDPALENEGVEGYPFDPTEEDIEGLPYDPILEEDKSGSMAYGYVEAKMMWKNGVDNRLYACESITEVYWIDIQASVFPMCDTTWPANSTWASYSQLCKTGAEKFVVEEMDKCFDVAKCTQVGVSAGASVAGTFCKQNSLYHKEKSPKWIPTKCVEHAKVSCKYDAVQTVQKFNQGGVCVSGSALNYVDELYSLCEQEVSTMEQAANLAGYY